DKTVFVESESTAFRLLTKKWHDNDSLSSSLREVFNDREEYKSKIECLEKMKDVSDKRIESRETAQKLFGKVMYESPSRVETFHKCHFQYFCRYGIKANKLEKSTIDPRQRGNVIHYCLEKLIQNHGMGKLCAMQESEILESVREVLNDYADEFMGGMETKSERFRHLYFSFERTVMQLVRRLIDEFSVCKFVPVDFELSIDRDGAVIPYELKCPDGTMISLRGKVDRVDSFEMNGKNFIRVIDYKTGRKNFVLSDIFYGLNMQMLVYLFTIWENGAERYGDVLPAGVLYMPSGDVSVVVERGETDDEIRQKQNKKAKMKGVVLKNSQIIEAMGEKFISAKISSKTGEPSGDVLSLGQLKSLKKVIDERLVNMAMELHDGNIEALPIEGDEYKSICEHCDYRDVCLIEEYDKRKPVLKESFSDIAAVLKDEEGDENG
ncbi:MAG: PD-(D/E)XK nuclease family protein, partial [Clostridia bacterium]|nr:PD-(D/E)XK nuclease family protein [Clostridia bacterium]